MPKFLLFLLSFPQNESLESCLFFIYTAVNQSFILENSPSNWRFSGLLSFRSEKRILRKVENQNDRIITSYNFTSVSLFITFYEKEHFCYFVYQNEQTETKELLKLIDL